MNFDWMATIEAEASRIGESLPDAKPDQRQGFKPALEAQALLDGGLAVARGAGQLYTFQGGRYVQGEQPLRKHLIDRLGENWQPSRADAITKWLYDSAPELWERPPVDKINLANGILNRLTGELEPHSPDFLSPIQLPVLFDPEADCPKIKAAIAGIIPKDTLLFAYQIIGLLCTVDTGWQRAFMLVGGGGNGKSTILNLIIRLIGENNITSLSLHDLANNRFAAAQLYGKLVNIHADLSPQRLESVSMFKSIVGNDRIYGEHKYGQGFSFQPFTRLVFSANEIPSSPDSSLAYTRRWTVIPCPNKFQVNESFIDSLTSPEELSGLFLTALNAYSRAKEAGEFSTSESVNRGDAALKEAINPVAIFVKDRALIGSECQARKNELYNQYREWCESNGRMRLSAQKFNKQLVYAYPQVTEISVHGWPTWSGLGILGP